MAGKLLEVEKNVQETHIAAQSRIKAITLALGSRIGRSQPYWKGETEPHTPGTKSRIYDLFLCSHKNKSPWETYGTSIKCVSLVCRFIFPSVSGCPFTRRDHSAMKPHVTHQTH